MEDKHAGRDLFHLVPGPEGEAGAGSGAKLRIGKPPLLGSRARASRLWLGEVRVHRGDEDLGGGAADPADPRGH